jgi:hypothetical protein
MVAGSMLATINQAYKLQNNKQEGEVAYEEIKYCRTECY